MTLKKSPNVQEIRGRFENWNSDGGRCDDSVIVPLGNPPPPYTNPETRNRSFSVFAKSGNVKTNDDLSRNNSFQQRNSTNRKTNFAEKQKLVESIVANIKSSGNRRSYRSVWGSLFDKDLKHLVRVQRQAKKNDERQSKENAYIGTCAKNQKNIMENAGLNQIYYNKCKYPESNNNPNVKDTDNNQIKSIYDNISDKYINNLNSGEIGYKTKLPVKHQLNSFGISPQEPSRPPRRRVTRKKGLAPSPPEIDTPPFRQISMNGDDHYSASSHHNLTRLDDNSVTERDSMNMRRNSVGDLYPFHQSSETFPNYSRDPFNDFTSNGDCPEEWGYTLPRNTHMKKKLRNRLEEIPSGPPPRKPPRTFAHDIYRQSKYPNIVKARNDLDVMYAKPMKKIKRDTLKDLNVDKTVSFLCDSKEDPNCKPPIAPKPHNIPYKRYSVIEPIESPSRNENDNPTIKRNTSFRFSFRKPSSTSPMANKQIARLKDAVRNFHFTRAHDGRLSQLSKSVEHVNINKRFQPEEEHIYAIPQYNHSKPTEISQELHYMCSPLFPMDNVEPESEDKEQNVGSQRTKMDWGGLKKEFRQSCRLVQKRIKGVVH